MTSPQEEEYKNNLVGFFNDLKFRYKIAGQVKKETDLFLSSDFNVFNFITPDENKLSDILDNLLNPHGSHGQGDIFLRLFLQHFDSIEKCLENNQTDIESILKCFSGIQREASTYEGRRIDLLIAFNKKFAIGIENKPWAEDQDNQIEDYLKYIGGKYSSYFFIYLNKTGKPPSEASLKKDRREKLEENHQFRTVSYVPELYGFLEKCWEKSKSEKLRLFLFDFMEWVKTDLTSNDGGK